MKTFPSRWDHCEFAEIDRHFAMWIADHGGPVEVVLVAAALSRSIRAGHICLDLHENRIFGGDADDFTLPPLRDLQTALAQNRAVGAPQDDRPLVLHGDRLYMRRYWQYETTLAEAILRRCSGEIDAPAKNPIDAALSRRFLVISGGPGTGKTTTVLKILKRMLAVPENNNLRIALAAPTGKAAARLEETLRGGSQHAQMPKAASTLHRMLGTVPGRVSFRHNAENPLPVDVVVVDEASMVPLPLMAKLFDALPEHARVILLGDQHQLASVEPGFVLGDIAGAAVQHGPLHGSLVELQKNYRFGTDSAIFAVSNAVREGDAERVIEIVRGAGKPDLVAVELPSASRLPAELRALVLREFGAFLSETDPASALEKFQQYRVICALRSGPYGADALNRKIETILREEGFLVGGAGLPVLITRNDHELGLFNGDTGVLLPDASGVLHAWFIGQDGSLRQIAPSRLPPHEPAFAMTVHKSQGSEYERALLVLPDRDSPVVTRELIYTGVTRARSGVELWFRDDALRAAVGRSVRRSSGLREKLTAPDGGR